MERKAFIKKSLTLIAMAGSGVHLISCGDEKMELELKDPIDIDLTVEPFDALMTPGNWLLHPDENVLLVNVAGDIRAFSSICPYKKCTRDWVYSPGVFTCICNDSKFDATGQYLSGPANANLREYSVTQTENIITIG